MKKALIFILITTLFISGCSSLKNSDEFFEGSKQDNKNENPNSENKNNEIDKRDVLSGTNWVYVDYKEFGFVFTEDGKYYTWELENHDDGSGFFNEGGMHEYTINNNTITLFEFNLVADPDSGDFSTIKDVNITYKIKGKTMTWESEYKNFPLLKMKRIDMTLNEYAESLGIQVPDIGGA